MTEAAPDSELNATSAPGAGRTPLAGLAVVTGATGHVGNTLVRHLLAGGTTVRALVRATSAQPPLDGLPVQRALGDVEDAASLVRAFEGADTVFHCAGLISISVGKQARLEAVNVEGTRHVVEACLAAGVRRLVYLSSVHALPEPPPGGVLTEGEGFEPKAAFGPYGQSKAAASRLVQDAARAGRLDAVLLLPTGVLGPWDWNLSAGGKLVRLAGRARMPIIIAGGYDWVDVRDVAAAALTAAQQAPPGEAFLLTAGHVTNVEFCRRVAAAAGVSPPPVVLPLWVARGLAPFGLAWEAVTGRDAALTPYAVHTLGKAFTVDGRKAARDLGFAPRPLEQTLGEAWHWLKDTPGSPLRR